MVTPCAPRAYSQVEGLRRACATAVRQTSRDSGRLRRPL